MAAASSSRSDSEAADISHAYTASAGPAGTGLFAARDLETGELVLRLEREVVSVLDSARLAVACERCFLTEEDVDDNVEVKLKKCGGCGVVRFCSEVGCLICLKRTRSLDSTPFLKELLYDSRLWADVHFLYRRSAHHLFLKNGSENRLGFVF